MMEAKITKHPSFPWPDKPWLLSGRFVDALEAAAVMFADKKRKGCDIPYISHLLAACAISLENGATEDEAIAALFHDAIEDIEDKSKVRALVGLFGPEVLRIVEACSYTDKVPKPPWRERKEAYLARLLEEDRSVLLVSAADKLHNARSIAADLRQHGAAVWERFNAPLKEQLWYYRELVGLYRKHLTDRPALVDELERAVSDMEKYPESP
jgi:(p)ppGpp synthase/HD superfamily hydrolase